MIGIASRATPRLTDLLQIEPGDEMAIQIGTEFLLIKESQIHDKLAGIEAELAESKDLPDLHVLERQAADALQALLDLIQPDAPAHPPYPTPAPMAFEPALPTPKQHGLKLALGLVTAAWLLTLAAALWFLSGPQWLAGRQETNEVSTPALTTTVVLSAIQTSDPEPTGTALATGLPSTTAQAPTPAPAAPMIPGSHSRIEQSALAAELQIPDEQRTGFLQVPLSIMTETVQIEGGRPILRTEIPAGQAGLHRASVPFGENGAVVVALPGAAAPSNLQTIRPGDRLAGCNADGRCYDYVVTTAQTWEPGRLDQVLAAWPPGLGLFIYTSLEDGTTWIIQAQPEENRS